jgi:hypothetical protein
MHALDREARQIREAIIALAPYKHARRFDARLEARIVGHVRQRLAQGATLGAVRESLDISDKTLTRFLQRARSSSALVTVEVRPAPPPRTPLVLRGPCGVSVTGGVEDLAALIARLSCSV